MLFFRRFKRNMFQRIMPFSRSAHGHPLRPNLKSRENKQKVCKWDHNFCQEKNEKKMPLFEQWSITDPGQREGIRLDTHWEGTSAAGLRCLCHFPHQRIVIASICIWLVDVIWIFDTYKKVMICIFIGVCIFATVVYTLASGKSGPSKRLTCAQL